jgi:hypothetical protein
MDERQPLPLTTDTPHDVAILEWATGRLEPPPHANEACASDRWTSARDLYFNYLRWAIDFGGPLMNPKAFGRVAQMMWRKTRTTHGIRYAVVPVAKGWAPAPLPNVYKLHVKAVESRKKRRLAQLSKLNRDELLEVAQDAVKRHLDTPVPMGPAGTGASDGTAS